MNGSHGRRLSVLGLLVAVAAQASVVASAQTIYRCGNSYSPVPCADGRALDPRGATPSAEQRAEAARVRESERRTAEGMTAERLRREASIRPAMATGVGPVAAPPATSAAASLKPKAKAKGKIRVVDGEDFVASVPKTRTKTPKAKPTAP